MSSEDVQHINDEFVIANLCDKHLEQFVEWAVEAMGFLPFNEGARFVCDVVLEELAQRRMHQTREEK